MVDLVRVGGILRAERKKSGKSIELMSEELALGTTTISSIERGLPTVSLEKYHYYAEKLGKGMLFGMASEAEKKIISLREQLKDIEEILLANPDKAIADLNKLNKAEKVESIPLLQPNVYYLKGKYYLTQKEWKLSEDFFLQAIQIADNQPELESSNLAAACYTDLGNILHHQNLFQEALYYANKGLECYVTAGERDYCYELLLLNKSIYLEELNLLEKALLCIEELERYITKNHSMENKSRVSVIIQMYTMYASILNKLKMPERALEYVQKGIKLAWINRDYNRLFTLWAQTGIIYSSLRDQDNAERYFLKALDLEPILNKEYLFPFAYVNFAKLLIEKKQWSKAERLIDRSIIISRKNLDNLHLAQSLLVFGDWNMQQKQYSKALDSYLEAEEITNENNFEELSTKAISSLCACYEALEDKNNFLEHAVKLYRLKGDK